MAQWPKCPPPYDLRSFHFTQGWSQNNHGYYTSFYHICLCLPKLLLVWFWLLLLDITRICISTLPKPTIINMVTKFFTNMILFPFFLKILSWTELNFLLLLNFLAGFECWGFSNKILKLKLKDSVDFFYTDDSLPQF